MMLSRIFRVGEALIVGAICTEMAMAWGGDGHRLVADFASARLSMPAKSEIDRLLTLEPGANLATISTWADEVRAPTTAPWHYVNFPRDTGCHYDAATLCAGGSCVVPGRRRRRADLVGPGRNRGQVRAGFEREQPVDFRLCRHGKAG